MLNELVLRMQNPHVYQNFRVQIPLAVNQSEHVNSKPEITQSLSSGISGVLRKKLRFTITPSTFQSSITEIGFSLLSNLRFSIDISMENA